MSYRFRDNKRKIRALRELKGEGRIYGLYSKLPNSGEVDSFRLTKNEIAQQASILGAIYNVREFILYTLNLEDNSRKKRGVMEKIGKLEEVAA